MKRNRVMSAASAILVLAVLTTCIFSGTMAKYIISDYTTDSARVAKFGVVVKASGDLFGQSYMAVAGGDTVQAWAVNEDTASINATDQASGINIVAPGTKNEKGMTFSVKGTPEVQTVIHVDAPELDATTDKDYANTDIYLKDGEYSIMVKVLPSEVEVTTDNKADFYKLNSSDAFVVLADGDFDGGVLKDTVTILYKKVNLTSTTSTDANYMSNTAAGGAYYPITWTLKTVANGASAVTTTYNGSSALSGMSTAMTTALTTGSGHPNVAINNSANITWAWEFGNAWVDGDSDTTLDNWENTSITDLEDTILGQMMARVSSNLATEDYLVAQGASLVKYATVDAVSSPASANTVTVAYVGDTAPTAANWRTNAIACLTATFGARVTVEQVD